MTSPTTHPRFATAPIVLMLFLFGCGPRSVTPQVESQASARTIAWLIERYGEVSSPSANRVVNNVASRIASSVYGSALERKLDPDVAARFRRFSWNVTIIGDRRPNAFSVGAGNIVLTVGMLRETRTEAELAAVLSHEMAHQLLNHVPKAIAESLAAADPSSPAPGFAYSLSHEIAADTLGLKLMHVARYDLRHAAEALSIGYRQRSGLVSGMPEKWLAMRMANLEQEIAGYGSYLPATATTRAFNKMRRRLFAG